MYVVFITYLSMYVFIYVCVYIYVRMYVCVYVCIYICIYVSSDYNDLKIHCLKIKNIRIYTSIPSHIFMVLRLIKHTANFIFTNRVSVNNLCSNIFVPQF